IEDSIRLVEHLHHADGLAAEILDGGGQRAAGRDLDIARMVEALHADVRFTGLEHRGTLAGARQIYRPSHELGTLRSQRVPKGELFRVPVVEENRAGLRLYGLH